MTDYPLKTIDQLYATNPLALSLTTLLLGAQGGAAGAARIQELVDFLLDNLPVSDAVQAALNDLVDAAPGSLDTLNELAAALGDDANFAATVTNALAEKQDIATLPISMSKGPSEMTWLSGSSIRVAAGAFCAEDTGRNIVFPSTIDLTGISVGANTQRHVIAGLDASGNPIVVLSFNYAIPSSWIGGRRLGSILTDASGAVRPFIQTGDDFDLVAIGAGSGGIVDFSGTPPTTATALTLSCPPNVKARLALNGNASSSLTYAIWRSGQNDPQPGGGTYGDLAVSGTGYSVNEVERWVDGGRQVMHKAGTAESVRVYLMGWIDRRKRDA